MAIDKTKLTGVEKVYPLKVSPYEQYMGDFQNPSVVSKVNAMIQSLHQIGRLTNETVSQWNIVMKWIVEGGMDEIAETVTNEKVSVALNEVMRMLDVSLDNGLKELAENVSDTKIDELLKSGQFESMIQTSLNEINEVVENKLDGFSLQLAETANKANEAKLKADAMASGSPKAVYATLVALQTAFPNGANGAFLVTANGQWYYWNETAWTSGGQYQATSFSTYKRPLTSSDNINDLRSEGTYLVTKDTTSGTYPLEATQYLIVEVEGTGSFITQKLTGIRPQNWNPMQWVRTWQNSWSNWVSLTTPENLESDVSNLKNNLAKLEVSAEGLPAIRELPNGVKDVLTKNTDGTYTFTQHIKETKLTDYDIFELVTTTANIDYVRIRKPTDYIMSSLGNSISGSIVMQETLGDKSFLDSVNNIGYISSVSATLFGPVIAKGTYTSLEDAKTSLIGKSIKYQLATPITKNISPDSKFNTYQVVKLSEQISYLSETTATKPLTGETFVWTGDSVIMGAGNGNDLTKYADVRTGANGINIGYGGATASALNTEERLKPFAFHRIADSIVDGVWTEQDTHIISTRTAILGRMKDIDISTVNKFAIGFGINDFSAQTPLGTIDSVDINTFIGSLRYGIEKLWQANGDLQFVLIAPYWIPNRNRETQQAFINAILTVGEYYNIPVLNLYKTSGINSFTMRTYLEDLLHPKLGFGYAYLGSKIGGSLCSVY